MLSGFSQDVTVQNTSEINPIDLINVRAIELPATGGIGIRIFKIVGFTLMSAAVIAFIGIIIRRSRKEEN